MKEGELNFQEFEHENFGYANGWNERPAEFERRENLRIQFGFPLHEQKLGRCDTRYYCEELNYEYKVDSSD